jgi:hypothetical protein
MEIDFDVYEKANGESKKNFFLVQKKSLLHDHIKQAS